MGTFCVATRQAFPPLKRRAGFTPSLRDGRAREPMASESAASHDRCVGETVEVLAKTGGISHGDPENTEPKAVLLLLLRALRDSVPRILQVPQVRYLQNSRSGPGSASILARICLRMPALPGRRPYVCLILQVPQVSGDLTLRGRGARAPSPPSAPCHRGARRFARSRSPIGRYGRQSPGRSTAGGS